MNNHSLAVKAKHWQWSTATNSVKAAWKSPYWLCFQFYKGNLCKRCRQLRYTADENDRKCCDFMRALYEYNPQNVILGWARPGRQLCPFGCHIMIFNEPVNLLMHILSVHRRDQPALCDTLGFTDAFIQFFLSEVYRPNSETDYYLDEVAFFNCMLNQTAGIPSVTLGRLKKRSKSSVQKINVSDYIGRWTIDPEEGLCVGLKLEALDHGNVPQLITMLPGDYNRHQYALVIMQSKNWCILQRCTQM